MMTLIPPLKASTPEADPVVSYKMRYLSLDVLRGLTIALMVLVNNPGSWSTIYAPFKHAAWHGFTVTDLVFPAFLFVVGNAMSFSMRKFRGKSNASFLKKVIIRTLLIFGIGLFLSAFPFVTRVEGEIVLKDLSSMRIMGVLQRIAICYFFAALMLRYLNLAVSIILSITILLGYWAGMYFFGDSVDPYSLRGNAALKFDLLIFPAENLWRGHGIAFDPEGLLSTIPAIVNVVAGYFAGRFIQKFGNTIKTVMLLALAGALLVLVGDFWNNFFPINKSIWTSSFVLYSTGWCLLVLSGLVFIIEILNLKKWTYFFEVFGRNPLFIYALSGIIVMLMAVIAVNGEGLKKWIYDNFYLSWLSNYNASLVFALSFVLLMWLIGYWMDKKKIYIKV